MNDLPAVLATQEKFKILFVMKQCHRQKSHGYLLTVRLKVMSRMPCPKVPNACVEDSGMNLVATSLNQRF